MKMQPTHWRTASAFGLVVVIMALSGCMAGDEGPSLQAPATPAPSAWGVTAALVHEGPGRGEPSLGVTPDGVLFTNAEFTCEDIPDPLGCRPGGAGIYRSKDGGATWHSVGRPLEPILDSDPDLAVGPDGTVWVSSLYIGCNAVAVSQDLGESWTVHPAVCAGVVGDRQYVVPFAACSAYLYWHQIPTFQQTVMKTTDCGETWLPTLPAEDQGHHISVNGGSGWGGGGFHNWVTDSTFLTYTYWGDPNTSDAWPAYSVTQDGLTWRQGVGPAFDGQGVGLSLVVGASDDAGNVYLAWGEYFEDDMAIFVAASQDDGLTWTPKVRVDNSTNSKVFPAIAAGGDGEVAVAFYEAQESGPSAEARNWTVNLAWTHEFFDDGKWLHQNMADGQIVREDPICVFGTTCSENREFLDYFSMVRLPDGRLAAAYNVMAGEGLGGVRTAVSVTSQPVFHPWRFP